MELSEMCHYTSYEHNFVGSQALRCIAEATNANPDPSVARRDCWMKTVCKFHYDVLLKNLEEKTSTQTARVLSSSEVIVKYTVIDSFEREALRLLLERDYIVYKKNCGRASLD